MQWKENPVSIGCEPLIALTAVTAMLMIVGRLRNNGLRRLPVALRGGLTAMVLLTGASHFVGMRAELVAMVPPVLPAPELLITLTGVAELAGAIGLPWRPTATAASAGLSALLIGVFPANVYAALSGLETAWYEQVVPRTVMQGVFLAATLIVLVDGLRLRRADRQRWGRTGADAQHPVAAAGRLGGPAGPVSSASPVEPAVQLSDLLGKFGNGTIDLDTGDDLLDRQRARRRRRHAQFAEPGHGLIRRARVDDPAEADPAMGCRAHRAVFARGVDGGAGALRGRQVFTRPAGQLELRMEGAVPGQHVVVVLEKDLAVGGDQHRAERLVADVDGLGGELDTPPEMT